MAPKNKNTTPNKPSDRYAWTDDESEEMHKDIPDLQKKIVTKEVMTEMMSDSQRKATAKLEAMMSDSQRKV